MKNMRKIVAVLAAVLMLCTAIPFATVSAAEEPTIEVSTVAVANAGDEIQVTVNLLNIPEPGLIGALVKLSWDESAMELVTYYDEDEEDYLNMIEIGAKYNASSNKYIIPAPLGKCNVQYLRATASATQVRYEEHFFTATFKIKDDAVSGDYTITMKDEDYNSKNFIRYGNLATDFAIQSATITINGTEPVIPPCEHEYTYDCDTHCAICGEETRPEAQHEYFYPCDQYCTICGEQTNPRANHNVLHVEAVEATCQQLGNIEYWYCDSCGTAWLDETMMRQTNMMSVKTFKDHEVDNDCDTDCNVCGTVIEPLHVREYGCSDVCSACGVAVEPLYPHTYEFPCSANCAYCGLENPDAVDHNFVDGSCTDCGEMDPNFCFHEYLFPCDQFCMHCGELTNPDATHSKVIHVEAVEGTCQAPGNIEYWTCEDCGGCWDNAECTGMPLNRMMIIVFVDHTYDDDADLDCNVCGEIREIDITIAVLVNAGTSVSKHVNGLAFLFNMQVADVVVENVNEYVSGSVDPYGEGATALIRMGAVVSNVEGAQLTLDNLDGNVVKDVNAKRLFDADSSDGAISFAVRVINIPNVGKNAVISACPYFIYELDGMEHIFYGDILSDTYANAMNG